MGSEGSMRRSESTAAKGASELSLLSFPFAGRPDSQVPIRWAQVVLSERRAETGGRWGVYWGVGYTYDRWRALVVSSKWLPTWISILSDRVRTTGSESTLAVVPVAVAQSDEPSPSSSLCNGARISRARNMAVWQR